MEKTNSDGARRVALMLLMASGADIVAPKELRRRTVKQLHLEENDSFKACFNALNDAENRAEKAAIIKALAIAVLTPSQIIKTSDFLHDSIKNHLQFLTEHPELRQEALDPDEAMERLYE